MEYTLPTTALVLEEVVAGRQPGDMVPQLPRVLSGRDRSDNRPKETALTIDRERRHAKSLQPLDPVLVLREDTVFRPRLGGFGTPGWIETRLGQGAIDHRRISERFLAFVAGLPEGNIEPFDRLIPPLGTRPGQQRKSGMTGSVGVAGVVRGLINLRQAQKLPVYLDRAHLGDFPDPQRRTPGPRARHIEVEIHVLCLLGLRLGRGCLGSDSHSMYLS